MGSMITGGRGYDPKHNEEVEKHLRAIAQNGWHQTWWGQLVLAVVAGIIGGLVVNLLS